MRAGEPVVRQDYGRGAMSEPMTNHEIEDVLSSIRRLVSEDLRPATPRPPEPAAEPEAAADKLLLTPAFRVVTPVAETPAPAEVVSAEVAPVEDVVARLGAAVADDDWESPFGDPEVWSDPVTDRAGEDFVYRSRMAPAAAEPDAFGDAPMAAFAGGEEAAQGAADPLAEAARAPFRRAAVPERDASWADAAAAEVHADLARDTEEEVISGLYASAPDGMVFDEEVLRDLVRDLIREELAGTLGERITRNVRKLVRAEIARALALREFD